MKPNVSQKLPGFGEIIPVLAFTAFLVYGRMLYTFVWKLPSWFMFLTPGEIFSILSYSLVFAMLESAGYVIVLLVICIFLPRKWFRDGFVVRSVWLVAVWLISLILFFSRESALGIESGFAAFNYINPWTFITLAIMIITMFVSVRIRFMRSAALWFADRTIIFLFIFLPASLVGSAVIAVRNIF